jgi:hypothetical protein
VDLKKAGYGDVDWINVAQDSFQWKDLVDTGIKLQIP